MKITFDEKIYKDREKIWRVFNFLCSDKNNYITFENLVLAIQKIVNNILKQCIIRIA